MFDIVAGLHVKHVLPRPVQGVEMTEQEKFAWASLAASVLVWAFFAMRMTDAGSVIEVAPRHMIFTYVTLVVLFAASHAIIATVLVAGRRGGIASDERDRAIEARAERIEGYVVVSLVNLVVIQALAEAAFPGHVLPHFDLGSVPTLVFVLISTLFAGHVAKQLATLWQYRT
jgi:hypothetical protein